MGKMSFLMCPTVWILGLMLFLLTACTHIASNEIKDGTVARNKLRADVRMLLHHEKYDELESMAHKFQKDKTRFPDGGWKLSTFYNAFTDAYYGWDELFRNLDVWSKKYPDSVAQRIAGGEAWLSFAWTARGSGYANTVTEEGWRLKRERVVKAYEMVKNPPDDPSRDCVHRYRVLLAIARAQSWDRQEYENVFQKAVLMEPSYTGYYIEKATYLLPRWHGDAGDWQKFANEAVKLTPPHEGMTMYTWILMNLWMMDEFKKFREPDISWEKMKQGFYDIEHNYPNSPYMLNYFCMFASIAGDKDTARGLFKRIGDEPYVEVWKGRSNFIKWQRWAGVN